MSAAATSMQDVFEHCRNMDASLTERLAILADAVRSIQPSYTEAVDRLVARLQRTNAGMNSPNIGEVMPPFLLTDENGYLVSLQELLSRGPIAVTFHRGHWCSFCRINISALAKAHSEIAREGGQIVAIVPERQEFAFEFKNNAKADFPVLTDMDNGYAMSLGLAFSLSEELKVMLANTAGDLATFQGNDLWALPIPATFVINRDSKIVARFVDPDFRKRMAVAELLAALRSNI